MHRRYQSSSNITVKMIVTIRVNYFKDQNGGNEDMKNSLNSVSLKMSRTEATLIAIVIATI